ncbi:activator-dependent family glycosyltransferase [Amycolatopsis anabasis]|uniref:activator-dependent family glycosyltransferase n=1 Tax=Amycolatopsis anabasis TaxID=1840409 RepID=UPI00131C8B10|nr:activator-dependent family glycosyltransferase [Amycolatopsis anabasis]
MRVLFTTYSEETLLQAMVPLAWAFRAAGHEVRVTCQPQLADTATAAGLTAVPVGRDHRIWTLLRHAPEEYRITRKGSPPPFDAVEKNPADIRWEDLVSGYRNILTGWFKMANHPMLGDVIAFARHWRPDLVLWDPVTYAGPVAAKAVGAAHGRVLWGLDMFGRTRDHFLRLKRERPAGDREDPLADWLGSWAAAVGAEFTEHMASGQFTVDQFPDSLRLEADLHYEPMRYVPYNGTAVVPPWLWARPERPRIALTLGITATQRLGGYAVSIQDILDALSDLDAEVVATLPDSERGKLARIPANARIVPFVPLHALIPTCSVVIHHAGFGSVNTTVSYGVPQLALPEHFDQPPLARRITAEGAGLTMHSSEATGAAVRDRVVRLLAEPSFRENAERLRAEVLALPAPSELVPRLAELTAGLRTSR